MDGDIMKPSKSPLKFDLGTFEGFNFRKQSAIYPNSDAKAVLEWDHDANGEAEFWPSGDRAEVALLFKNSTVTGQELMALNQLLQEMGGDTEENFIRIHHAINIRGCELCSLSRDELDDHPAHIFIGTNFLDVRKEAAFELFELYYPEAYEAWESSRCDGLIFDEDRFLDSPSFSTEEVKLGEKVVLIVTAN